MTNITLEHWMNTHFPNLKLRPPLFYNWNTGIRFELGDPDLFRTDTELYMERVYHRAIELFKALHDADDEIMIVTNAFFAYRFKNQVKKLNLYRKYLKSRHVLRNLQLQIIPDIFADEDETPNEEDHTYRYTITCRVRELDFLKLIKAICNQDVGIKPLVKQDVFFIHINKGTIYHIYDDRGCDVVAASASAIKDIYEKYNDWILKYDREAINRVFNI